MASRGISERLGTLLATAGRVYKETESDAVVFLSEAELDWEDVRERLGRAKLLVVTVGDESPRSDSDESDESGSADDSGGALHHIHLEDNDANTHDLLSMALLEAVADEHLRPGARVVALYRSFDEEEVDSLSVIRLDERLERLTAADLRKLETDVPLETLKAVVDLAVDIGREGREGHPVGTIFVVGDTRKVMKQSSPMGFDPLRGYSSKEKSLRDRHVREAIKEIAQLDGAIIVDAKGFVVAACRRINSPATGLTLSKGLGSRHWAAAAVTKATNAIAVVVSQSSGTVRIFDNGQVVLPIAPLRRAMKWHEPPQDQPPEWLG
jgi:DNA integrity scanning protein DisA with diadenylate cyclase activity